MLSGYALVGVTTCHIVQTSEKHPFLRPARSGLLSLMVRRVLQGHAMLEGGTVNNRRWDGVLPAKDLAGGQEVLMR